MKAKIILSNKNVNYHEIINSCVLFQLIRFRKSPACVTFLAQLSIRFWFSYLHISRLRLMKITELEE